MKVTALIVVLAGCFSKPPAPVVFDAPPIDAPTDGPPLDVPDGACVPSISAPGLMSTTSVTPTVTWPGGHQLRFGDSTTNVPMPDFLSISGQNVLALPQPAQCGSEDQLGIAVFPTFGVSASNLEKDFTLHALDRNVIGPAYSQFTVHWGRSYTCGSTSANASGNTIFSLFPDGRIIRNDTVTPANTTVPVNANCDCTGTMMANFIVTAYLAVRRDLFASYSIAGAAETAVTGPVTDTYDEEGACVVEAAPNDGRLAVAWETPTPSPGRTRLRNVGTIGMPAAALVFVYDLFAGSALSNVTRGYRTTMVMARGTSRTCADLHAAARVPWPPISIGPTGSALGIVNSTPQRVHVDPTQYTGPITLSATNGNVPPGLVISVRIPGTGLTTSRTDGVVWQREADGRTFVWFRDAIPAGQSITITPDC